MDYWVAWATATLEAQSMTKDSRTGVWCIGICVLYLEIDFGWGSCVRRRGIRRTECNVQR